MITVRELIEISPFFLIRVNGSDYDKVKDHYADDWIVEWQCIDVYVHLSLSCEPDEIKYNTTYLSISAKEPSHE